MADQVKKVIVQAERAIKHLESIFNIGGTKANRKCMQMITIVLNSFIWSTNLE